MVEEIMLLANKTAASELIKLVSPNYLFAIFRIMIFHQKSEIFIDELAINFKIYGSDMSSNLDYNKLNESLQKLNSNKKSTSYLN